MLLLLPLPGAGTGKTTLAHVVAGHCGFRVVEVNASDERSAAALTRRITDVAQMTSVLDGEGRGCTCMRPSCLLMAAPQDMQHCCKKTSSCRIAALLQRLLGVPLLAGQQDRQLLSSCVLVFDPTPPCTCPALAWPAQVRGALPASCWTSWTARHTALRATARLRRS